MNRAERRRQEKGEQDKVKTLNLTVESFNASLQAARDDERKRYSSFMISYYSAAVAMVLRDKWGFGKDRLCRIIGQINEMYASINDGYVDINDIHQTLLDECGLDFKWRGTE